MVTALKLVYVAATLVVAITALFTITWVARDAEDGDPTSDLLRAIAASAFLLLMTWPLVT